MWCPVSRDDIRHEEAEKVTCAEEKTCRENVLGDVTGMVRLEDAAIMNKLVMLIAYFLHMVIIASFISKRQIDMLTCRYRCRLLEVCLN